jgi:hypothetical protein
MTKQNFRNDIFNDVNEDNKIGCTQTVDHFAVNV